MKRRHALSLIGGFTSFSGCRAEGREEVLWRGILFGIEVSIRFRELLTADAKALGEEAHALARKKEAIFSLWDENSELRRLNRDGKLTAPSQDLFKALQLAKELHQKSQGLFDPSVHSYLEWLKAELAEGRDPTSAEKKKRRSLVDFSQVQITRQSVTLPPGGELSLNGIAQGYITDAVHDFLKPRVSSALVNFGEYRVIGQRPFPVEIRGTQESWMLDRALAVSSGSGQRLTTISKENHLIDPFSGDSPPSRRIVAVEAETAWLADALATIVALGGEVPPSYPGAVVRSWDL